MAAQRSVGRTIIQPIAIAVVLAVVVRFALQFYSIPSDSMAPTLSSGDRIIVTPYFGRAPGRGEIVVFRSPADPDILLVKRVIALPGDLIETAEGRVRVGGYTLAEPYLRRQGGAGSIPAQLVPAGRYFVMGDNRHDSVDSRNWGAIHESMIVGRARLAFGSIGSISAARADASTAAATDHAERRTASPLFKWLE